MTAVLKMIDGYAVAKKTPLFSNVNLEFKKGQLTCILGPNGAGKSSLLKCLAGLQELTSGSVELNGSIIGSFSHVSRALQISYLPQIRPLAWPIRVEHAVALGRFAYGASIDGSLSREDEQAVAAAIKSCDLQDLKGRRTDTLSGGELARVHIARALAGETEILLADEPMAALDPRHQLRIMDLIQGYSHYGGTALVVMHDMGLAARFADRLVWMKDGCVVADGAPSETLTADTIKAVFDVEADVQGLQVSLKAS